jgi:branched-chain amino acid transport system substrate-binding protein
MRIRNRVLTGATCVTLAAVLAACGTTAATTTTIAGTTLTIYASLPLQVTGPESSEARDVLAAEQLALQQAGGKVGRFTIVLKSFNDATGAGWSPKLIAANARTVIQRDNAVAYIGEIDPNASAQSIPITNADQMLQVSPYDTAIGLTQATAAVSGSPDVYYQSLSSNGRTFGRVVPNDTKQAKAQLQVMQGLGVKKLFIAEDGGAYGDAIALAVDQNAAAYGVSALVPVRASAGLAPKAAVSGADAMFYGGVTSAAAVQLFNGAAAADPQLKLFGPSGLYTSSFTSQLAAPAQRATYLSEPGEATNALPPAGRAFLKAFKAAYHHTPWTQAIFGYAAMQAVLAALRGSDHGANANNRADDVAAFFATKNRSSALGTYTIDKAGDTSLAPYIFSRVKGGKLVAFKGLTVP